ncbi:ShlB/FhaC/HecB family hemolysin secretion/activation protein [Calothrix sp. 336/3]|uniref:ShlB/FhaC/HecB family hemolysin secretion/activation protein n=1 Tax=Calothrix sp. 336/3 TaxID=1337936 RepID=UPI00403FE223
MGLGVGKPLNRDRLLEALKLIQVNPLIESISAELSSGSRPELSFLDLKINEANTFRVDVFADNGRAPSVGTFRRGISISESNTTGFGDRSFLKFTNTDGSNAYDFSYALPVNPRNGEITLGVGFSNTSVVEPPFAGRIDVNGDSNYIDVGFRQPLKQSSTEEFAVGFNFSHQESKTRIFEVGFPLSEGADDNGITRINALRFVQEYTKRDEKQVFALRSQFSIGLGWFNSTVNKDAPDGRFLSWRGQSQYVRLLAPDTLFLVRSDLQLASRALVPLEQFGVGGLQSVRGYRQDQLLTDNGFYASTEVRFPILRMKEIKGLLQFVPFFDFGVGWNGSGKQNPDRNAFASVGAGLQFQIDDRFNARLDYGIPLTDVKSGDRTLQEQGLYFSVNYRLF